MGLARHLFVAGRPAHRYSFFTGDEVVAASFALFQVVRVAKVRLLVGVGIKSSDEELRFFFVGSVFFLIPEQYFRTFFVYH